MPPPWASPYSPGAALLLVLIGLLTLTKLFRKVEQGKALIVSKLRKVDVTFTGSVVLPVLHKAEVMDISVKTIEITRAGKEGRSAGTTSARTSASRSSSRSTRPSRTS